MKQTMRRSLEEAKIINLPKIQDPRGNLSFLENETHIPFDIQRSYWIYDVPGGATRGGHAFREQHEVIIVMSGSVDVVIEDGNAKKVYSLNRSYYALYIPNGLWRQMCNFSTNSFVLVLASNDFDQKDYIYNFSDYLSASFEDIRPHKTKTIQKDIQIYNHYSNIYNCNVIELDKHHRDRGNLTIVENMQSIPFEVRRAYYLYDIPGGESRGGHAHKKLRQLIVAVSGSFDVVLDDGEVKRTISLNRPYQGLLIVPGIWRELENFSSGAVCLVLASNKYDEDDYIRDYNEFIKMKKNGSV
jgi:dTDP-4-dehydrorhamnose 3,5-epimerase-like enzyme